MGVLEAAFAAGYDRVVGIADRRGLGAVRAELLQDLRGDVLEIGAGSGLNLPHYPRDLDSLTLTEPMPEMAERLRDRLREVGLTARVLDAPAEALPVAGDSVDHVVSTFVFCTLPEPDRALNEVRRVLRPGGTMLLIEHVADDGLWGTVQTAIAPAWRFIARGCELHRDTATTLESAGFDLVGVGDVRLPASVPWLSASIVGVARPR